MDTDILGVKLIEKAGTEALAIVTELKDIQARMDALKDRVEAARSFDRDIGIEYTRHLTSFEAYFHAARETLSLAVIDFAVSFEVPLRFNRAAPTPVETAEEPPATAPEAPTP